MVQVLGVDFCKKLSEYGYRESAPFNDPNEFRAFPIQLFKKTNAILAMLNGAALVLLQEFGHASFALFMCDWSYGKLYAVHLMPHGSAYKAEAEEFLNGVPLPVTDIVINPKDGALYFIIGGRRTQAGLYRVTYVGKQAIEPALVDDTGAKARAHA